MKIDDCRIILFGTKFPCIQLVLNSDYYFTHHSFIILYTYRLFYHTILVYYAKIIIFLKKHLMKYMAKFSTEEGGPFKPGPRKATKQSKRASQNKGPRGPLKMEPIKYWNPLQNHLFSFLLQRES